MMEARSFPSSSPAQAGDPVITAIAMWHQSALQERSAFTGCPAFAGHDERESGVEGRT
jgi:hypothetical protein